MTRRKLTIALAAIAALATTGGAGAWVVSEVRLAQVHEVPPTAESFSTSGDAARGMRLAKGAGLCTFCHGSDLSGTVAVDDLWIGRLYAPNLTSGKGGAARTHTDRDFDRALRHGIGRDGRSLLVMPAEHLRVLSERDLADLVAYLRAAPPRNTARPPTRVGPLTRVAIVAGLAPDLLAAERVDHHAPRSPAPLPAVSREYGGYLVALGSCRVCHRADLRGGLHPLSLPGEPPPPDLTSGGQIATWSTDDFVRAMRTGVRPDGQQLDARYMPWTHFARMSENELAAVWLYLRALPAEG